MGVDVKGVIKSGINFTDLQTYMESHYQNVEVPKGYGLPMEYAIITFEDGEDKRSLHVHACPIDGYDGSFLISLSLWGKAQDIIEGIIKTFGGWYCADDCSEVWSHHRGILDDGNGLPYFIKYGVSKGMITDSNDLSQLVDVINDWNEKHNRGRKPVYRIEEE